MRYWRRGAKAGALIALLGAIGCSDRSTEPSTLQDEWPATPPPAASAAVGTIDLNYISVATGVDNGPQDGIFDGFTVPNLGSVNNNGYTSLRTAFEFSLSSIPVGAAVTSAKLTLDLGNWDGIRWIQLHGFVGDGTVQLSDFALGGLIGTTSVDSSGSHILVFDITDLVASLVARGTTGVGFNVREEPPNTWNHVIMRLNLVTGPVLSVAAASPCDKGCPLTPTLFIRRDGQTAPYVREFPGDPATNYQLVVQDDGQETTGAEVKLNGETYVTRTALRGLAVRQIKTSVPLRASNRLTVLPLGKVGARVTVWIESSPSAVIAVSAGYANTCVLQRNGGITCWGYAGNGLLTTPVGTFVQLDVGGSHACARAASGQLACWGHNFLGQATPPPGSFMDVGAGTNHTCAVRVDGSLACWGENYMGGAAPPATGNYTRVAAGTENSCAIRSDGGLTCWGDNKYGQLVVPAGTFTQVGVASPGACALRSDGTIACWGHTGFLYPPAGNFTQLSVSMYHACALRADGTVACWGFGTFGETSPPGGAFVQIAAGTYHTCGVRPNGSVTCWGRPDEGQCAVPSQFQ